MKKQRQYRGFMMTLFALLLTFPALADDDLHEGQRVSTGVSTQNEVVMDAKADFRLIKAPGSKMTLNGSQLAVKAGFGTEKGLHLDAARAQLLRWSHLRVLGIEADREAGSPVSVEIGGFFLPLRLAGTTGGRDWVLAHAGASLGYRWLDEDFDAEEEGHGAYATVQCRLDENVHLTDRLSVRAFQEILYTGWGGVTSDSRESGRPEYRHALEVNGGVGLYLDITGSEPVRLVPRTDPRTGEKTYRRLENPGRRLRWQIVEISGSLHLVDTMSVFDGAATAKTGMSYDF